jgi:tetratricopeptide (TPR) repeat protein
MRCLKLAAILIGMAAGLGAQVRVWQGTLTLPVYQEGQPDVNPPFDVFTAPRFNYPYTLRTSLTGHSETQNLRAVYLENEYLKCEVLPDIGGHLYSCTDKLSGHEMFYANPSIKKQLIGYRGVWAAFGIEFNFPVSHNWMSMSPVDFAMGQNPDGSASVFVGSIDRPYSMQWMVELILRPGSTLLEQKVTLYNRSDLRHRYYYWNNAGVEITNDSQIVYPMRFTASHGFTYIDTWPVNHEGKDISIVRNHTSGPVSQFMYGSREQFTGVWHPNTQTGVIHYSDFADIPGKKIWSFGVDADGLDWRRALSDNNSGYVEVQAGPFRNQETYAFLPPQELLRFSEWWMPVRATGGISRANLDGVVYLHREDGRLVAALNVNHRIPGAVVKLKQGDQVLAERSADLDPAQTFTIDAPNPPADKCTFELSQGSAVLIAHTEDTYDWTPKSEVKVGPQAPVRRESDPLELGRDLELNGALLEAAAAYASALSKDPDNFELNVAAGRLAVALKNYPLAVRLLSRAQYRSNNDPEIHYYLGHAYAGLDNLSHARTEWEGAQAQPQFRAPARLMLARLAARSGDLAAALRWVRLALAARPDMVRAGGMEVALLRALGQTSAAAERLAAWRKQDPTSSFLRLEDVKAGHADEALWQHFAANPERVLDVAEEYMELGLYRDAVDLLAYSYPSFDPLTAEPGAVLPQDYPLIAYYRGYCRQQLHQSALEDFKLASGLSTRYVFPNRPLTFPVLKAALTANAQDATAHFLLGSLYMSGGMFDEATREWDLARKLNPRIPVLHRNLGRTLQIVNKNDRRALEIFQEGLSADPANVELYEGISECLAVLHRPVEERLKVLESYPDQKALPTPLVLDTALSLAEAGRFDAARKMFYNRYFEREEGGTNVRGVFLEVQLLEALAAAREGHRDQARQAMAQFGKEVPGLVFTRDGMEVFLAEPRFQFYSGQLESLLGNQDAARAAWKKAAEGRGPFALLAAQRLGGEQWKTRAARFVGGAPEEEADSGWLLERGLALRALGREKEAVASLEESLRRPDRQMSHYMARRALAGSDQTAVAP